MARDVIHEYSPSLAELMFISDVNKRQMIGEIGEQLSSKGEDWLINYIVRNRFGASGTELLASSPLIYELYHNRSLAQQRYYFDAVIRSGLLNN